MAPISGPVAEPVPAAACVAAHRNSAVSRPSRPTASIATTTRLAPPAAAASTRPLSSPERVRAERAIHITIQVTKPTATIDSVPPIASCASKVSPRGPKVSSAPNASETATAIATPAQTRPSRLAAVGLHEVGHQDHHDERGLEALAEPDEVVREHGGSPCWGW